MKKVLLVVLMAGTSLLLTAQSVPVPANLRASYEKGVRSVDGKPGPAYWQNSADYRMNIQFDPASRLLEGKGQITYKNNSPEKLNRLVIRLYPDLYKKGVVRDVPIAPEDETDGVAIKKLSVNDETISTDGPNKRSMRRGTNLIVNLGKPIEPNSTATIEIEWSFIVNKGSQMRTGMVDPNTYFIAYSIPRIAVFDDVDGWDNWSYSGTQEFYNDFGDFDVAIQVPAGFVVWATGELGNPSDIFSKKVLERLATAAQSDKVVHIIENGDYQRGDVFKSRPSDTWKFSARYVPDFAFAVSNHYLWDQSSVLADSTTGRRVLASAVYNTEHKDYYEVAEMANECVHLMSHRYPKVPFPYPQITVVDGTDQMEYPMMVNDNPTETRKDAVQLTSHEIFHTYFPFYMGINETKYGWMDEGWASIGESVISPLMGEPESEGIYGRRRWEQISGTDNDMPLIVNTKLYNDGAYIANIYGKAGICYWVLQDMLGDERFFQCLHGYMDRWNGKHPTPYDFFFSFDNLSGEDLGWFWRPWFFEWTYPDLAIEKVEENAGSYEVTIANPGKLPLPVRIRVTLENGQIQPYTFPASIWKAGNDEFTVKLKMPVRIKNITLGDDYVPDKYKDNNTWGK